MSKHVGSMGYSFPDSAINLEILSHKFRRLAKHAALAEQQRQCLERVFRDGLLNPWGGNGILPYTGTYIGRYRCMTSAAILAKSD